MPADQIKICNLALAKIGSPSINDLQEDSREARSCGLIYDPARDEVLQLRPWPSCVKRASLALLSDAPPFEFSASFQLPGDFLDIVRLGDNDDSSVPYKIEGRQLLTNSTTANVIYIWRNEDVAQYEPMLVDLIATRMAVYLALQVANNASLAQAMQQQYEVQRQRAKSVDGMTTGKPDYSHTSFSDARS